jgi:hypothetical protein
MRWLRRLSTAFAAAGHPVLCPHSLARTLPGYASAVMHSYEEDNMSTTVAQMTKEELKEMIETTIEQKLLEMLGDPDEELRIRKTVRDRLLRQKKAVAEGERGRPFEDVVQQLGLG